MAKTVIASAAVTAAGSQTFSVPPRCSSVLVQLDVTAAATDVGDKLTMWVQGTIDGTNYYDIGGFAEVLGNGGAKRFIMVLQRTGSIAESDIITPGDGAMTANTVTYGPFPDDLRIKYTVTDAGTDNASFTFSVTVATVMA
ncbi:MAG: hypothetical protein WC265_05715 [Dysgonamonadaceae bacterium]|jgi:hypothetical protein